jgi:hypothetical protein
VPACSCSCCRFVHDPRLITSSWNVNASVTNGPCCHSITNPQKFLPLPKVTLEAHALGHLKGRDQTALDRFVPFPALPVEVSGE